MLTVWCVTCCPDLFGMNCTFVCCYVIRRGAWVISEVWGSYLVCPLVDCAFEVWWSQMFCASPHTHSIAYTSETVYMCVQVANGWHCVQNGESCACIPSPHPSLMTQWPYNSPNPPPWSPLTQSHAALNRSIINANRILSKLSSSLVVKSLATAEFTLHVLKLTLRGAAALFCVGYTLFSFFKASWFTMTPLCSTVGFRCLLSHPVRWCILSIHASAQSLEHHNPTEDCETTLNK